MNPSQHQLNDLLATNRRMAFGCAWRLLRNREDAEDCVQRASLNAFVHWDEFRGDAQFGTWFYRIVSRQALMMLRERTCRPTALSSNDEGLVVLRVPCYETPERVAIRNEKFEILDAFISELTPTAQLGIRLAIAQGIRSGRPTVYDERIQNTDKARIFRARKQLNQMLADRELEELKIA
jgi:RNA polymerase sigma-70 factor, ECF subfamily